MKVLPPSPNTKPSDGATHPALKSSNHQDPFTPQNFKKRKFAHRGGSYHGPENTLETIKKSFENGANAIEVDIQLTANNKLVLFHDFTIERVLACDFDYEVYDLTLREISAIPLRDTTQGTQYICSLVDLLDYLAFEYQSGRNTDFLIELEIKIPDQQSKRALKELYALLERYNPCFGGRVYQLFYVSTFFKNVLDDLQDRPPQLKLGLGLIWRPEYSVLMATVAIIMANVMVRKYRIDVIEPCLALSQPWYIRRWQKRGLLLNVHTVNTVDQERYANKMGVAYTVGSSFCDTTETAIEPKEHKPSWKPGYELT